MRQITEDQARAVLKILVEECGHAIFHPDRDEYSFVYHVTRDCREFRFCGALGFGGKFRNNGNHDNTPYVDCYPEHETPDCLAMIEAANRRLDALFNPPTIQGKIP
jgi:hypothetical protein